MKTIDYIVTAKHYSEAEGADGTVKGRVRKRIGEMVRNNRVKNIAANLDIIDGAPVEARIYQGSWIADCADCGGAEFVEPDEPIFFCLGCLNRANNGNARPVIFPDTEVRRRIERLVLRRPVSDISGVRDVDRANGAKPVIFVEVEGHQAPLLRTWMPGETVEELEEQNVPILAWEKINHDNTKAGK